MSQISKPNAQKTNDGKNQPGMVTFSESIRVNATILEHISTSMSALSGFTAGIIGLYSFYGFIFYVLCSVLVWVLILAKVGSNHEKYFRNRWSILTNGLWSGLGTYVLFWTFIYGMVHVY